MGWESSANTGIFFLVLGGEFSKSGNPAITASIESSDHKLNSLFGLFLLVLAVRREGLGSTELGVKNRLLPDSTLVEPS